MKTFLEPAREIPIAADTDVVAAEEFGLGGGRLPKWNEGER
jgi:hypothetical protein